MSDPACPVCRAGTSTPFATIDGFGYFECGACGSLHIDPQVLAAIDAGEQPLGAYADRYWKQERKAAQERAAGSSLCCAGEAILYCRRPVERFLDVGTGPGYLLERLQALLDPEARIFHGVEKFPPAYAVDCPNFDVGDVAGLDGSFDAGTCIEVIEHLTPAILDHIARALRRLSRKGSLWLLNSGMPEYVKHEDPGYLDPTRRGHIVSYSIRGLEAIFAPHGFRISPLPGKSYASIAEFDPDPAPEDFSERIYRPLPENDALLARCGLLRQATIQSARASYYFGGYLERTRWALSLDRELAELRDQHARQLRELAQQHEHELAELRAQLPQAADAGDAAAPGGRSG